MPKVQIQYTDLFALTMQRMREDGLLLVTMGADGTPNVMTIGWGMIGSVWARPVFTVLVRPSRHSYSRLEQVSDFAVNVPPSRDVKSPIIQQCVVHYECRILHRNDLVPEALAQSVREQFYPHGDFHRFYSGEIVAAYADDNAESRLRTARTPTSLP